MSDKSSLLDGLNAGFALNKVPLKIVPQSDDSGKRTGFVLRNLKKGKNIYEVTHKNPNIAAMVFHAFFTGLVGGIDLGKGDETELTQLREWEPPEKAD